MNIMLNTDSYKVGMDQMYPPGTEFVHSYIESRGGRHKDVVFFGLQMFIKEYLTQPITKEQIDEAEEIWAAHGEPFNRANWEYIIEKHKGFLPIVIKAVPEGTVVPYKNVLVTIENTDPNCFWLTTWLETSLLRAVWYPSTVATNSREIKKVIAESLKHTGTPESIGFKLHDFGMRGCSSLETSAIGGLAHLVNFQGTDTISAILAGRKYYNETMAGYSIPAGEHSVYTAWGRKNEVEAYRNMLKKFGKPGAIFAAVSDSYNIFNAVEKLWGEELRQEVIDSGATVVIRPDSGDPATVVRQVVSILADKFGTTTNSKGFKVLNNVRVIQGDGINLESVKEILQAVTSQGFSADNLTFGMGGALLQAPNRDDQRWAMKCSAAKINGEWVDVFKDPITDHGKISKKGRLGLTIKDWQYVTTTTEQNTELREVFRDGKLLIDETLEIIRKRAKI